MGEYVPATLETNKRSRHRTARPDRWSTTDMAKHCTVCKQTYADNLTACPYCAAAKAGPPAGSHADIDLEGETTWRTESKAAARKERSDHDEDWSSLVEATEEGTVELPADAVQIDAPEDKSILGRVTMEELASRAGRPLPPEEAAQAKKPQAPSPPSSKDEPSAEASDPTVHLSDVPVSEMRKAVSSEEIDLVALSSEPEDSLAAEFARLGPESQVPTAPRAEPTSGIDFFEEQVLSEGASQVRLGEPQRGTEPPSGLDLIAEAVESGVELGKDSKEHPAAGGDEPVLVEESRQLAAGVGASTVDLTGGEIGKGAYPTGKSAINLAKITTGPESDVLGDEDLGATSSPSRVPRRMTTPISATPRDPSSFQAAALPSADRKSLTPWLGGSGIGAVIGAAACYGVLWLTGALGTSSKPVVIPMGNQSGAAAQSEKAPDLNDLRNAFAGGQFEMVRREATHGTGDELPELNTLRGKATWLSYLRQQHFRNLPMNKDDGDVREAVDLLTKANTPDARYWLGLIEERAGDLQEARRIYTRARDDYKADPRSAKLFQAALDRLDSHPSQGPTGQRSELPADPRQLAHNALILLLVGLQQRPGADDAEEAGFKFWEAAKAAKEGRYADAIRGIKEARDIHEKRRVGNLFKAQNPTSDPDEQIFLRSCQFLEAFWQLQSQLKDLKDKGYDSPAALIADLDKLNSGRKAAEEKLKEVATKLAAVGVTETDLLKGIDQLAAGRKPAPDAGLAAVVKELKSAGVAEADPAKAVAKLAEDRRAALERLQKVGNGLKAAKVAGEDPAQGVAELANERDALLKQLDAVAAKLRADRSTLAKAVDGLLEMTKKGDPGGQMQQLQAEVNRLSSELQKSERDAAAKAKEYQGEVGRLQAQLKKSEGTGDQAQQLRAEVNRLLEQVKRSEADAAARTQQYQDQVARLQEQLKKNESASGQVRQLQDELVRLRELLERGRATGVASVDVLQNPAAAEEHYSFGLGRYWRGDYAAAEKEFAEAVHRFDQDARYLYFRGLSRLALGKQTDAEADFRAAADLEQISRPGRKAVNASLERVQGPARQTLNEFRPRTSR